VSSCVRFAIFFQGDAFKDPTWESVVLITWTVVEAGVYLIAACLPHLRPLILHVFGRVATPSKWSTARSSKDGGGGGGGSSKNVVPRVAKHTFGGGSNGGFNKLGGLQEEDWASDEMYLTRLPANASAYSGQLNNSPRPGEITVTTTYHVEGTGAHAQ
jgi:hypothetical protein